MNEILDQIENEIVTELKRVTKKHFCDLQVSQAKWTTIILSEICGIGSNHKFIPYCTELEDPMHKEWLFDACWSKEGESWKEFKGLELVCELEWNDSLDEILSDFMKLTIAVSRYKVMIIKHYDKGKENYFPDMVDSCKATSRKVGNPAQYLMIGIPTSDAKNVIYSKWVID